jgi:hypothetical protein
LGSRDGSVVDTIDQALIASIGIVKLASTALVVRAYIGVRLRFESYLKARRPEFGSELFPSSSRLEDGFGRSLPKGG